MSELPKGKMLNAVDDIGAVFAVRAQCAWLGWPTELEPRLLQWMRDNHSATRSKDNVKMAQVAQDFDDIIRSVYSHIVILTKWLACLKRALLKPTPLKTISLKIISLKTALI